MYRRFSVPLVAFILVACQSAPSEKPTSLPSDASSEICVVRHAEAYRNLEDPPADMNHEELDSLTQRGHEQARQVAVGLENVVAIWTSPTGRTRQTADLLGFDAPITIVDNLDQLESNLPWDERLRTWSQGEDPQADGLESLQQGHQRVKALLAQARELLGANERLIVVTHGDIAAIILGQADGTPLLARPVQNIIENGTMRCVLLPET